MVRSDVSYESDRFPNSSRFAVAIGGAKRNSAVLVLVSVLVPGPVP